MLFFTHITVEKFKVFGEPITVNLSSPTVLIGPNNAGKTTIIQALALWSWGVKNWFNKKGGSKTETEGSTSLNRSDIIQVPVKETRFFWKDANIRSGNNPTEMKITVGVLFEGKTEDCTLIFKYYNPEQIFCSPSKETFKNKELLKYVSKLKVDLLYPMSGIDIDEPLIQEGRINLLIGQGQTAQVLRNLCYKIFESDSDDWKKIQGLMNRLFHIALDSPFFNTIRGSVELTYTVDNNQKQYPLDISLAGRGQQQMLLLLAYLYLHKGSILLVDEPDAHLEILRQRQIYSLLKELSFETHSQIIIATHSEVIVDEAIDSNLSLLLNGKSISISDKSKIKDTLRTFGIEHYYKAELKKRILYVEGSTDIAMLREFAALIKHDVKDIFDDTLYSYYITDNDPESGLDKDLNKTVGNYLPHKKHFHAIKACVPDFKGIAIFDNDNMNKDDEVSKDLAVFYWKRYELENYFIFPHVILNYFEKHYSDIYSGLFEVKKHELLEGFEKILNAEILDFIFEKDIKAYSEYDTLPPNLKKTTFKVLTSNKKMSLFFENVLKRYSKETGETILINKGEFSQLIKFMDANEVEDEIKMKLDYLYKYLNVV